MNPYRNAEHAIGGAFATSGRSRIPLALLPELWAATHEDEQRMLVLTISYVLLPILYFVAPIPYFVVHR